MDGSAVAPVSTESATTSGQALGQVALTLMIGKTVAETCQENSWLYTFRTIEAIRDNIKKHIQRLKSTLELVVREIDDAVSGNGLTEEDVRTSRQEFTVQLKAESPKDLEEAIKRIDKELELVLCSYGSMEDGLVTSVYNAWTVRSDLQVLKKQCVAIEKRVNASSARILKKLRETDTNSTQARHTDSASAQPLSAELSICVEVSSARERRDSQLHTLDSLD